jgi:hypothetical protein
MVHGSKVMFRKYTRRIVLGRRNLVSTPERSVKYIHKSATFATMMSDIGIERIAAYVRSMANHAEVLAEMNKTGFINDLVLAVEVESISEESERTGADLTLIGNSLIRFMHTDSERIKNFRVPRTRMEKTRPLENQLESPNSPVPLITEAPKTALALGDPRE